MRKMFFVVITALLLVLTNIGLAQLSAEFWIKVSDDLGSAPHMLWFGNHINGTYGVGGEKDSLNPTLIERESPPPPPGLGVVWKPSRANVNWGNGFLTYDFKGFRYTDQADTFKIIFQQAEDSFADITFEWPDSIYFRNRCATMTIRFGTHVVDMFAQNSYTLVDAGERSMNSAIIIKNQIWIIDGVNTDSPTAPESYCLSQNIPNPFNPSTVINYQLPKDGQVSLKVYNILGEEIATLVDAFETAGYKLVRFDATNLPSGMYFYRIQAGGFTDVKKLVVMK